MIFTVIFIMSFIVIIIFIIQGVSKVRPPLLTFERVQISKWNLECAIQFVWTFFWRKKILDPPRGGGARWATPTFFQIGTPYLWYIIGKGIKN